MYSFACTSFCLPSLTYIPPTIPDADTRAIHRISEKRHDPMRSFCTRSPLPVKQRERRKQTKKRLHTTDDVGNEDRHAAAGCDGYAEENKHRALA